LPSPKAVTVHGKKTKIFTAKERKDKSSQQKQKTLEI